MIINLKRVAKIVEEKKANPLVATQPKRVAVPEYYGLNVLGEPTRPKPGQLNPLWLEFNKLFDQVKDGATTQDLKALVDSIKDFQPRLENLFDQARHVDQYGTMPKVQVKQGEASPDTWLLKDKGVNSSTSAVKF